MHLSTDRTSSLYNAFVLQMLRTHAYSRIKVWLFFAFSSVQWILDRPDCVWLLSCRSSGGTISLIKVRTVDCLRINLHVAKSAAIRLVSCLCYFFMHVPGTYTYAHGILCNPTNFDVYSSNLCFFYRAENIVSIRQ